MQRSFVPLLVSLAIILTVAGTHPVSATDATLTAAAAAKVGEFLDVSWTGPDGQGDFISIDPPGAGDRSYGKYSYTRNGSPLSLRVPDEPGDYEIRYHLGTSGYEVIASTPLRITDTRATVEAPASAEAGTEIEVSWTGPDGEGDFVSIDPVGAGDRSYGKYFYTKSGKTQKLRAPDEPGEYEVRYHLGQTYRVIGSSPITVGGVGATLEASPQVEAGGAVEIAWTGPDGEGDFVSIDPVGSIDRSYGKYFYAADGSPGTLRAPDEPGDYEIRYHLGQTYKVIATAPLKVTPTSATVNPPAEVEAGQVFEVQWTGPDQDLDFLTIVPVGTPERQYENYAYTRRGNPLRLEAPDAAGEYEVRYCTGQKYLTLASAKVTVTPGTTPGSLRVIGGGDEVAHAGAVELILDASGSMLQKIGGQRRIDLAKQALTELTRDVLPTGTPFALRVFGHREADSCRTDLEIPLAPLDVAAATAKIRSIEAKNLAKTPIADSLAQVRQDLANTAPPRTVVLVTDGEETCGGDPEAAIEELRAAGFDLRVNIVGFAIDELMLREEFESWARLGQGGYFDARDGDDLSRAVRQSLALPFEVVGAGDEVVATGAVGGDAVSLPPGTYQVRLLTSPPRIVGEVTLASGGEEELRVE